MDNRHDILQLLRQVADGSSTPEEALSRLKREPFEDLGYAKVDLHRGIRQGPRRSSTGRAKLRSRLPALPGPWESVAAKMS